MNALDDYVYKMMNALKKNDIDSREKKKINSAIKMAKKLLGDNNLQDEDVFLAYLKEFESLFKPIIDKIG
ncbi:Heat shock protein 70kD, C-terminal domain superfamily [Sesbania bispinosa]|nr:Heat shock protein 70kD, C-terminal domain superfamily [Sesbania bispinosa]